MTKFVKLCLQSSNIVTNFYHFGKFTGKSFKIKFKLGKKNHDIIRETLRAELISLWQIFFRKVHQVPLLEQIENSSVESLIPFIKNPVIRSLDYTKATILSIVTSVVKWRNSRNSCYHHHFSFITVLFTFELGVLKYTSLNFNTSKYLPSVAMGIS